MKENISKQNFWKFERLINLSRLKKQELNVKNVPGCKGYGGGGGGGGEMRESEWERERERRRKGEWFTCVRKKDRYGRKKGRVKRNYEGQRRKKERYLI